MDKKYVCVLCKGKFVGWGNNPAPLKKSGKCCSNCNVKVVMARLNFHGVTTIKASDLAKSMGISVINL